MVPGHIQRGGTPCAYDRVLSTQFGVHAADLIKKGKYGVSVALVGNEVTHNKLSDIAGVAKPVPKDHQMVDLARNIGIRPFFYRDGLFFCSSRGGTEKGFFRRGDQKPITKTSRRLHI